MASTSVVHPLYKKSTNVISLPAPSPEAITQIELTMLLSLRGRAKKVEEDLANAERSVKERLEAGGLVELGEHTATLRENFRRSVSWREVTERLGDKLFGSGKGDAYCERVLRSTKPTRSVSLTVS